ncbi:MAG: tetraacyldisaccharide 4'-kinase [Alphaproteobacteria bacterium]|nr:tetraacyldisaccharide 4'-kinase [Alphaproteobacteria bacterium]
MKTPKWFLEKSPTAYLLWPVGIIYYCFSKLVYFYRLFGQKSSKRPVICIGNILAGGVGKTPIVLEIAKYLKSPVVMRGYKKSGETAEVGDEAKMLTHAGIDVHVGSRKNSVKLLNNKKSKTPIVMDDGFQNPTVKKDLSILVFDENIGTGNGFLLPAGPLREPLFSIKRADAVIVIKGKNSVPNENYNRYGKPVFYAIKKNIMPKNNGRIIAFAGIGYPQKFFNEIIPRAIEEKSFPDHYQYNKSDLNNLLLLAKREQADLVTTEKDWVRIPLDFQKSIKVAKLETNIEPSFWQWLELKIKEKNK